MQETGLVGIATLRGGLCPLVQQWTSFIGNYVYYGVLTDCLAEYLAFHFFQLPLKISSITYPNFHPINKPTPKNDHAYQHIISQSITRLVQTLKIKLARVPTQLEMYAKWVRVSYAPAIYFN